MKLVAALIVAIGLSSSAAAQSDPNAPSKPNKAVRVEIAGTLGLVQPALAVVDCCALRQSPFFFPAQGLAKTFPFGVLLRAYESGRFSFTISVAKHGLVSYVEEYPGGQQHSPLFPSDPPYLVRSRTTRRPGYIGIALGQTVDVNTKGPIRCWVGGEFEALQHLNEEGRVDQSMFYDNESPQRNVVNALAGAKGILGSRMFVDGSVAFGVVSTDGIPFRSRLKAQGMFGVRLGEPFR